MRKIGLVGYCHAVAILDGIGTWREALRMGLDHGDKGDHRDKGDHGDKAHTPGLQGWDDIDTEGRLFDLVPKPDFAAFQGMKFALLNGKTPNSHPLAVLTRGAEGAPRIQYTPVLHSLLTSFADFDVIISAITGGENTVPYLRLGMPEYDFAPYDADAAYWPVDTLYVARHIQTSTTWVEAGLSMMRHTLKTARIIHIAPPPPPKDYCARHCAPAADGSPGCNHVRPTLHLKYYRAIIASLRTITANLGITLVEASPEALTEDGFLKIEFQDGWTRGNRRYGELVAAQLAELL
jgi:hypothetical protein